MADKDQCVLLMGCLLIRPQALGMAFIPLGWPQAFKIETPVCVCVCLLVGDQGLPKIYCMRKARKKQYEFLKVTDTRRVKIICYTGTHLF